MKTNLKFYTLLLLVATLISCNTTPFQINYIPCQVDEDEDWGFVNNKGEVFLQDEYEYCPTLVMENLFVVREGDSYSLYRFDKKKPVTLIEDLVGFGTPVNGLMPICKKDCRIEIVNPKGGTVFTLDKIDGQEVVSCAGEFCFGYLVVNVQDADGEKLCALVDEKGKTVIKPRYDEITVLTPDLFYVNDPEKDGDKSSFFINKKGEKQSQWKNVDDVLYATDKYVAVESGERCYIYNLKGEEVLKCPSKVQGIKQMEGNLFVYRGEDYDLGVMNIKGEKVLADKYENLTILPDGRFLVCKDNDHSFELMNKKADDSVVLDDFDMIYYLFGFGALGVEDDEIYILDKNMEKVGKTELAEVDLDEYHSLVYSDYFDYETVSDAVKKALSTGLTQKGIELGAYAPYVSALTDRGANSFNGYDYGSHEDLAKGEKYTVSATFHFDESILSPVYIDKQVQRYDYWYGYYYDTERAFDHYEFNDDAQLVSITVECNVPYDKEDKMKEELKKMLGDFAQSRGNNVFQKGSTYYVLNGLSINITNDYDRYSYPNVDVVEEPAYEEEVAVPVYDDYYDYY